MLGALPLVALTACSGNSWTAGGSPEPSNNTDGGAPARTTATPTPTPTLSAAPRYVPQAGEVEPQCKAAAVAAFAAALTGSPPQSAAAAASRVTTVGGEGRIGKALQPFLQDCVASTVRVIYPQYGGLSDNLDTASVMVVAEQIYLTASDNTPQSRELAVDMRLTRSGGTWRATQALVPQTPPAKPPLSEAAVRLLENAKVILPGPARADVAGGVIDEKMLQLLLALSVKWRFHVQVLRSGHPVNVFGTKRKSNHTLGRAVDIWAIDGIPVIDRLRCDWEAVMREADGLGATEIGGPAIPDGRKPPGSYFTNLVHQDHLHLAFDPISGSSVTPAT